MWSLFFALFLVFCCVTVFGFNQIRPPYHWIVSGKRNGVLQQRYEFKKSGSSLLMMNDANQLDESTKRKIESIISNNNVVLFMKGTKVFPQCGFSNTAVRILEALGVPFESVNVLEDETIRSGIKIYSSWPTIPQLYVNKEFIGGSDIMIQMYNSGELAELIEVTRAK